MKIPWGEILVSMGAGLVVRKLARDLRAETPEPVVIPSRFVPQPFAVYMERIVWALTPECDPKKTRSVRNVLNRNEQIVRQAYAEECPPETFAERVMTGEAFRPKPDPDQRAVATADGHKDDLSSI